MMSTGLEPVTIHIAARRSSPRYALRHRKWNFLGGSWKFENLTGRRSKSVNLIFGPENFTKSRGILYLVVLFMDNILSHNSEMGGEGAIWEFKFRICEILFFFFSLGKISSIKSLWILTRSTWQLLQALPVVIHVFCNTPSFVQFSHKPF